MAEVKQRWVSRIVGHGEEAPDQLLANPLNWRTHPKPQQDALADVLDRVGWVQDVIVNRQTGHVVDGHLRVSLAISREEPALPVAYVDLTLEEEALILASFDPLSAMAGKDEDILAQLLGNVSAEGALGDMLTELGGVQAKAGNTDPDDVPQEPEEPITQRGDVWTLGEHRVMCGDSTSAGDVERLIAGAKADVLWTDPPYGVSYVGKTKESLTIQNDGAEGLGELLVGAFSMAGTVLDEGSPFYIARPPGALALVFGDVVRTVGWRLHQELQWVKDSMVLGHSDYHLKHETIMYGWLPGEGRSGRGKHAGSRWFGDNSQVSVFEIPRPKRSEDHPTSKPVELVTTMLGNSSRAGDAVYEPFLGSGTTLIAAEQIDRRCYAMEIEPKYVDVAVKRWENYTGQKGVRA